MPDHWHGILQMGDSGVLSRCVGEAKGRVARALCAKHPHIGAVWQDGFHDQAIRGERHLREAGRYIVLNPVRAGIVERIGDYPYWDAVWLQAAEGESSRNQESRG